MERWHSVASLYDDDDDKDDDSFTSVSDVDEAVDGKDNSEETFDKFEVYKNYTQISESKEFVGEVARYQRVIGGSKVRRRESRTHGDKKLSFSEPTGLHQGDIIEPDPEPDVKKMAPYDKQNSDPSADKQSGGLWAKLKGKRKYAVDQGKKPPKLSVDTGLFGMFKGGNEEKSESRLKEGGWSLRRKRGKESVDKRKKSVIKDDWGYERIQHVQDIQDMGNRKDISIIITKYEDEEVVEILKDSAEILASPLNASPESSILTVQERLESALERADEFITEMPQTLKDPFKDPPEDPLKYPSNDHLKDSHKDHPNDPLKDEHIDLHKVPVKDVFNDLFSSITGPLVSLKVKAKKEDPITLNELDPKIRYINDALIHALAW